MAGGKFIKYYRRIKAGEKVPRKAKIMILGYRLSNCKLRKMIAKWKIGDSEFCPKCGCEATSQTGNMVEYPERYVKYRCLRCGELVAMEDNSPFVHVLELGGTWPY